MSRKIIDVLEPYEEEVLFSWVIRMIKWYSPSEKLKITSGRKIMNDLFSERNFFPGLHFQKGLDYFITHSNFEISSIFSSEKDIINKMTVLPFFYNFIDNGVLLQREKYLKKYNYTFDMRCSKGNLEEGSHIKICPKCWEEEKRYLQKEHQISGNFICLKHKCELRYLEYQYNNWQSLDFYSNMKNTKSYDLNDEETIIALEIANMIHSVFVNGLKNELLVIKEKIRSKLRVLSMMDENYNFYDYNLFLNSFGFDNYFAYKSKEFEIFKAVYNTETEVNPVIYLLLIKYLFGSLEELCVYDSLQNSSLVKKTFNFLEWDYSANHSIDYYLTTMDTWFWQENVILGDTKKQIVLKHKICEKNYCINKNFRKILGCPYCKGTTRENIRIDSENQTNHQKIRYLTSVEYAEKHGKESKQIRNYCNDNRIDGAIWMGKYWLIPEDAIYPRDKRYKNIKEAVSQQGGDIMTKQEALDRLEITDYFINKQGQRIYYDGLESLELYEAKFKYYPQYDPIDDIEMDFTTLPAEQLEETIREFERVKTEIQNKPRTPICYLKGEKANRDIMDKLEIKDYFIGQNGERIYYTGIVTYRLMRMKYKATCFNMDFTAIPDEELEELIYHFKQSKAINEDRMDGGFFNYDGPRLRQFWKSF